MIETAARGAQFLLAIGIAYLVAIWFAIVAWTFRDIESRSRSVFTQVFSTLLPVLFFLPGLVLYLILRPKETIDQAFQRALEEEYLLQDLDDLPLCPGCQRTVEQDFVLCPQCHTRLRGPCPTCSKLIDLRWEVCPYCANAVDRSAIESQIGAASVHVLDDARLLRRRRAIAAAAQRVGIEEEELDALNDALLASGTRPAVGSGQTESLEPKRSSPFAELSRFRERVQPSANRGATNGSPAPETGPNVNPPLPTEPRREGFWAEPLPGDDQVPSRRADPPGR